MLFLEVAPGLDEAINQIKEAIQGGLGPIALLSQPDVLMSQAMQFGIDFGIQIAATILLFLAVRFFFWKPITNILETRRQAIDKDFEEAEAARKNAIELEQQAKAEYDAARQKIKDMLDEAQKSANVERDRIINEAMEYAKKRKENLTQELEQEKKSMESQIKQEIVDIAFAAAEKIVSKEINQKEYLDVVNDILKGEE